MKYMIEAIGHTVGSRTDSVDDNWGNSLSTIELDPAHFTSGAFAGLDVFSHAEVILLVDKMPTEKIKHGARHPSGWQDWPLIRIFSQRGKNLSYRLKVVVCRIISIEGASLVVEELDAIDGTPVIYIKPIMLGLQPDAASSEPDWACKIMQAYW
jgi:tRNA (adenine37-N6)-methyltransferase